MPKAKQNKRNNSAASNAASPYAQAAAKTKAANSIFKMNTDMGQHVLKNPGIAQAIVDKADLKQSDVSLGCLLVGIVPGILFYFFFFFYAVIVDEVLVALYRSFLKLVLGRVILRLRYWRKLRRSSPSRLILEWLRRSRNESRARRRKDASMSCWATWLGLNFRISTFV